MLIKGQIVKLSNNCEYIVINTSLLHNFNYVYLINRNEPHDIVIATEVFENKLILKEIKDNEELKYILTTLNTDKSESTDVVLRDVSEKLRKNEEILESSLKPVEQEKSIDRNSYLMRLYSREVSNPNSDSFDRYMANNSGGSNIDSNTVDFVNSLKKYIVSVKGRKLSVSNLIGIINDYKADRYNKEFNRASQAIVPIINKIEEEQKVNADEFDYSKSLVA